MKSKRYYLLTIFVALLLLSGCARVITNTTVFYTPDYHSRGNIVVLAADADINNSLEFAHYKSKFENKLSSNGYRIVKDINDANYIALVAYGIDKGKTSVVSTPIFGQTGGGTTYSSGTVYGSGGASYYSGSSYSMPTYGVVGSAASSRIKYTRAIALDIVDANSLKKGKPKKVYESRAKSTGKCSVIVEVFDEMLEAMFKNFPGENGRATRVDVSGDFNC